MPQCPLASRNCIGIYHNKTAITVADQKYQRQIIRYLSEHPGDPLKRARADLLLQSLLFITNITAHTSTRILPPAAHKKNTHSPVSPAAPLAAERQTGNAGDRRHYWHASLILARTDAKAGEGGILPAMVNPAWIKSGDAEMGRGDVIAGRSTLARRQRRHAALKTRHDHGINLRGPSGVDDPAANKVKAQTRRITAWLIKERLAAVDDVANHIYPLINRCIDSLQDNPGILPSLARELSKPSGDFGSYRAELLSEKQQQRIFSQWLDAVVFKPGIGEFIARALVCDRSGDDENPPSRTAIRHLFSAIEAELAAPATAQEDAASPDAGQALSQSAQRYILDNVVFADMPTLRFYNETAPFAGMDVGSVEWVYLHAGLRYADSLALDGSLLSKEELLQLGYSLEEMLSAAVIDAEVLFLFDAPARIFYSRQQRLPATERQVENIFHGTNASSVALEAFFAAGEKYKNDHNPAEILLSALGKYQTRTALSPDLAQATALFQSQNEDIAAKYAVVDALMLSRLLEDRASVASEFIAGAAVRLISAKFSAFKSLKHLMGARHIPRHAYSIALLPEVDLLAASVGSEIRIFALRPSQAGYSLERVDKITAHYYALMTDPTTARKDPDYQLEIYEKAVNAPLMKSAGDTLGPLIENLVMRHKQRLMDQLHQFGFEETSWEKTQKFLLSLVPFHDCLTGLEEGRREAIIPCLTDAFSLVPLAGQGVALSARFAQRGAMGGIVALRASLGALVVRASFRETLRRAGTDVVHFAVLPASRELNRQAMISLGLTAIRAMDPGVELAGFAGARTFKQLVSIAEFMNGRLPVWQKIRLGLEQRLPPVMAPPATPVIMARLAGLDKELPVVKLGGDKLAGQDVYVRFNPETGEAFGKKYQLALGNILQAIPLPMAKRLRNILEQGMGGRGAPGAGKAFAAASSGQPYAWVTAQHLAAWVENAIGPLPTTTLALIARWRISVRQWRGYVSPDGVLTARGREMLQNAAPVTWRRILDLPPAMQQRILGPSYPGTLSHTGLASPAADNAHRVLALFPRQSDLLLAKEHAHFNDIWHRWAAGGSSHEQRGNAVVTLQFCLRDNLKELDLRGLGLRSLPTALPPQVVKLKLSHNELRHFQGVPLPNLTHLDISHNRFSLLPRVQADKLETLIVHHNQLQKLPATQAPNLSELDVSYNEINMVNLISHGKLMSLKLNNNELTTLPDISQLKLKSLYLDHNFLTELPRLPETLTIFSAANNILAQGMAVLPHKLTNLDLSFNLINKIPQQWQFSQLLHLKLNNNQISDIQRLLPPTLITLSANHNFIMELPPTWPPKIRFIGLQHNDITTLANTHFPPGLRLINLNQNHIQSLSENLPAGIKKIFIADNKLKAIMTNVPRDLELIDVSKNMIKQRPAHLPVEVEFINTP
ncbi:hypothetical protein [Sodalis sp. RH20]|uniref:hypothetical protein n=1 Tax=unclassified Sodalis (in: enterobacteria) TaxID=2636512 RepID=UPI0039B46D71